MPNGIANMIKAIKDWCLGKFQPSGDYAVKSDLNKYSLTTDTGKEISLSMDPNNYVMKLSLKNADGKVLSEKTLNLPLESVVIGIDFDKENKTLVLQLQNGSATEPIDISDLVSGLVSDSFTIAGIDMKDNITESELRTALSVNNVENVSTNEQTPTFTQYTERNNIESGETLAVILGKVKKFFADLQPVAFSSRYDDLADKPASLPNPETLTFTGSSTGVYDGSSPVSIQIPTVYMTQSDKDKLDRFRNADDYALKTDLSSVYRYKGSLYDDTLLPTDAKVGDTYNLVTSTVYGNGSNVAWDGTKWDKLGETIDLSGYIERTELEEIGNQEIENIWNTVFNS